MIHDRRFTDGTYCGGPYIDIYVRCAACGLTGIPDFTDPVPEEDGFLTARNVLDALRKRHDQPRNGNSRAWVYTEEVRVSTGFGVRYGANRVPGEDELDNAVLLGGEQRIDAFALHTWPSQKYRRVAYEVKASRSDLRRELDRPHKCAPALALSNEFYLVVPSGMRIDDFALPIEWGVMLVSEGRTQIMLKAPWRDTPFPPYSFMLSLARNLGRTNELA